MKKVGALVLAALVVLVAGIWTGEGDQAWGAPHGMHGVRGGFGGHGGYGGYGGYRGHGGFGHGHGGGHFSGGVWFGPGWWWDPFFYPYYPAYPYYSQPPVVIQQAPQEYVAPEPQEEEQPYWYYCRESKAYYPYVKRCPGGWLKVVPTPAPPGPE